ncbi:MAG: hypothetical protein RL619_2256, partial [Bacteroidota bacterium]
MLDVSSSVNGNIISFCTLNLTKQIIIFELLKSLTALFLVNIITSKYYILFLYLIKILIMVSFKKHLTFLSVVSFFLLFSCQSEVVEESYNTQETITKTTPLTSYVKRVVIQKTAQDNIIDNTDCFMIKLPYIVTINNVEIPINSYDDYVLVKNKINENSNDNDVVYIHFPVTVIFNDYSEMRIDSQTDFNDLVDDCKEKS